MFADDARDVRDATLAPASYCESEKCTSDKNRIPYSRKYWRGIKFGGLRADRQIKIRQFLFSRNLVGGDAKSANFDFRRFSRNPPNIIPANISGYMVYTYLHIYIIYIHVYIKPGSQYVAQLRGVARCGAARCLRRFVNTQPRTNRAAPSREDRPEF